jgi:SAM-dependent methyltransferase
MDRSQAMLDVARARSSSLTVGLMRGDIRALGFADASFDVVVSAGVLEYVEDTRNAVAELVRVTRLNGLAVITFPNLIKLCHVGDPYYYMVRGFRYALAKTRKLLKSPHAKGSSLDLIGGNVDFDCRRFSRREVERVFAGLGCRFVARHNVCFSSPTVWQRPVLGVDATLALSRRLCALADTAGFRWLGAFADRWVFVYRKVAP